MRGYAKVNAALLLWMAAALSSAPVCAGKYDAVVKYADLFLQEREYLLSADIKYRLSSRATEALKNGVPLYWRVDIEVLRRRDFWWDASLIKRRLRFKIQYQALLNVYRVHNEDNGEGGSYSSLAAALDALSTVHFVPLFDQAALPDPEGCYARLRVVFDHELLPLPLRSFAYLNPQWYLSSDWYTWDLRS